LVDGHTSALTHRSLPLSPTCGYVSVMGIAGVCDEKGRGQIAAVSARGSPPFKKRRVGHPHTAQNQSGNSFAYWEAGSSAHEQLIPPRQQCEGKSSTKTAKQNPIPSQLPVLGFSRTPKNPVTDSWCPPLQKTQGWGSLRLWSSMEPKRKGGPAPRPRLSNSEARSSPKRHQEGLDFTVW